jgi:hypothetical protein
VWVISRAGDRLVYPGDSRVDVSSRELLHPLVADCSGHLSGHTFVQRARYFLNPLPSRDSCQPENDMLHQLQVFLAVSKGFPV